MGLACGHPGCRGSAHEVPLGQTRISAYSQIRVGDVLRSGGESGLVHGLPFQRRGGDEGFLMGATQRAAE